MTGELVLVANAGDQTISSFALRSDLAERVAVTALGAKCSTFAIDRDRGLVYAGLGGDAPAIATLGLNRDDGSLTEVARVAAPAAPTYLSLDAAGGRLFGAFYHDGLGTTWTVTDAGLVPGATTISRPNLHCVVPTGDGSQAYFVSLGSDLIAGYSVADDGTLTLIGEFAAPGGSGPRHLVLDDEETSAYVLTEFSCEALHYRRAADGQLALVSATPAYHPGRELGRSRFGADPRAEHLIWGADLQLSRDGLYLWCSERTESTIATLPIGADGRVEPATAWTNVEPQPRGFCVTDDGRLVVTGERSSTIGLYRPDAAGRPILQVRAETGSAANWAGSAGVRL